MMCLTHARFVSAGSQGEPGPSGPERAVPARARRTLRRKNNGNDDPDGPGGSSWKLLQRLIWFNIAGANGDESVRERRENMERDMTRAEISRATSLARACMASDYQDCEL